mgnify:FL=1
MKLQAQIRSGGDAKALRRAGRLPAVVYNRETNQSVSVETRAFDKAFRTQGTSSLIDLDIDGTVHSVLVKQVQMDKRRREPMHVDFYAVTADQPVDVNVPVEFVGNAIGVREGGQLDVQRREVRISVLPRLIPNHVEVDVSDLAIGGTVHVSDVVALLPAEARVIDDLDLALVAVVPPRVAEEAEDGEGTSVEPELVGADDDDDEGAADD